VTFALGILMVQSPFRPIPSVAAKTLLINANRSSGVPDPLGRNLFKSSSVGSVRFLTHVEMYERMLTSLPSSGS